MRLVAVRRIEDGTVLARDVSDGRPSAIPLLRAGVPLTSRHRSALIAAGINAVYVEDSLSEGINVEPLVSPETRQKATQAVSRAFEGAREAFDAGHGLSDSAIADLQKVAEMIASEVQASGDIALAL